MAKSKASKASDAASAARNNPYVQRALEDEDLRENVRVAFEAARDAYGRFTNGKGSNPKALLDDKKLQKDLKKSADALKEAGSALREGPKRKKRFGLGKLLLVALVGGGAAVAASEGLRNKVLDLVFGAEEEFDYTSTTAPPPAPAEPSAASTPGAG
jgi:hypothetical protein